MRVAFWLLVTLVLIAGVSAASFIVDAFHTFTIALGG